MSDAQDIREWAAANGIQISDRGRIRGEVRDAYEAEHNGSPPPEPDDDEIDLSDLDLDGAESVPEPSAPPPPAPVTGKVQERKPQPTRKRRGLLQRKPKTPKPKVHRKPISIENLISSGWALGAMALARSPSAIPVARILDMQAPIAGVVVEDMTKGTAIHRLLEPLARAGEKGEKAFALLGPPILVGVMTARPEMFPVLKPVLKMSMMSWLQVAGPATDTITARAQKFSQDFGDLDLDGIIDSLWAGIPQATADPAAEDEAIRRARGE
jgi:hypothetical protein